MKLAKLMTLCMAVLMVFTLVACTTDTPEESSTAATSSTASTQESKAESSVLEASSEPEASSEEEESSEPEEPLESIYDDLEILKVETAPKVDGKVEDGEYPTIFEYNELETHWNYGSSETGGDVYDVKFYLGWDEEYLYTCVSLLVGSPRTYDNTDFTANRPYIFDRRHVMTAIVLDNPRLPKFQPADGVEWPWGDAYNSGLATEWSLSAQPDGTNIKADHFGAVTTAKDYEYIVAVSDLDREYYEQKIPWSALAGAGNFTAEVGAMIGYSFSCCCEEVDIELEDGEDDTAVYVCFGNGIAGYKHFGEYVGLTLTEE